MLTIDLIRQKVMNRHYYLSSHAEDEMVDDLLSRADVENAILKGRLHKKLTKDIRGTRYRVIGPAQDHRQLHVLCRILADGNLLIITVYALREEP